MHSSSSSNLNVPSSGSICSQVAQPRTVLKLASTSLGHTSRMYFAEVNEEFCSSPASIKKGSPLTMSCFEVGVASR